MLELPSYMTDSIVEAGLNLLESKGVAQAAKLDNFLPEESDDIYYGAVRLTGDFTGRCEIFTNLESLIETHSNKRYGKELTRADALDWVGEIANRFSGAFKSILAQYDGTTQLGGFENKIIQSLPKPEKQQCIEAIIGNEEISIRAIFIGKFDEKIDFSKEPKKSKSIAPSKLISF